MKSKGLKGVCVGFVIVLAIVLSCPLLAAREKLISIGTGGTGGVYYPYGGGLAEIWTRYVPGVKAVAEVTGASVENVRLANRGESLIGEAMNDVVYMAYYGTGRFKGKPQKILAMFEMYPHHYHVVALKGSGIKTIYDIRGKHVSVGAPGSGTEFQTKLVLGALGISYKEFKVHRLSFTETANALKDGTIDVGIWSVAAPTSSVMDLATKRDIVIISFSDEELKKICDTYPFYSPFVLPPGTYKGVDYPVKNPSVWNTVICNADIPEDLVYKLVKAVFEHKDYLEKIHPFAKYTTPENTLKAAPIPLHPGALRYYRELGLEIPDRLLPKK
ncbi:MAG: C4-dicarboxylate ABC transporter substrate-binding protein [Deltaproteobacteria bacterium]|nr:MAG: C4-dicarboxylate ABC transporter substrate-binding protein [Deltaproteobacteria bacterium]